MSAEPVPHDPNVTYPRSFPQPRGRSGKVSADRRRTMLNNAVLARGTASGYGRAIARGLRVHLPWLRPPSRERRCEQAVPQVRAGPDHGWAPRRISGCRGPRGNAVVPQVAEVVGRRLLELAPSLLKEPDECP